MDALGEVDVHERVERDVEDASRPSAHAQQQGRGGGGHAAHVRHDGDEVDGAAVARLVAHVAVARIVAWRGDRRQKRGKFQGGVLAQAGQGEAKGLDDLHVGHQCIQEDVVDDELDNPDGGVVDGHEAREHDVHNLQGHKQELVEERAVGLVPLVDALDEEGGVVFLFFDKSEKQSMISTCIMISTYPLNLAIRPSFH